jgi:hypothetical protein
VLRLPRDETLVTLFKCFPRGHRAGVGHDRHCAAATRLV